MNHVSYILHRASCILIFAIYTILLASLSACGQDTSIPPDAIQVTFKALEAPVTGMTATLLISGMSGPNSDGSYAMTVNADGTVTATMSGVPAGDHTFTITYYDPSGLVIAQGSTTGSVAAGSSITLTISQPSTAFDADNDGFTNLVEINSGSNPSNPGSAPTGTWTTTGAMNQARVWHVAILLSNGKVLVAGGGINPQPQGRGDYLDTAELYDPATGTFTYTGSMNVKRGWHTSPGGAVLLNNGKVLVVGGYFDDGTQLISLKSAELFDPSTGAFSYTGSMNNLSGGHVAVILLQSGKVLVTGFSYAEIYDPSTGIFSLTGNPIYSRMMHTATLLSNGKVLITGGHSGTVALSTAEVYDPVTGTFSQTGNMNYQRWLHTATLLIDGRVLITGGTSSNSTQQQDDASILSSAEIYDPSTGTFSLTGTMNYPRITHTATPLSNGNVLIAGGSGGSSIGNVANAEFYDPSVNQFRIGSSMITPRGSHSATLLSSGKVLVAGGQNGPQLRSAELFTPP